METTVGENVDTVTDILVRTGNPDWLDKTLNGFGAALVGGGMPGGYTKIDGCYVVRCFGDVGFIKFAMKNQGWAEYVRDLEVIEVE